MMGITAAGLQAVAMGQSQQAVLIAQQQHGQQLDLSGVAPAPKPKVMCQHPGCGKEFAWQQDLSKHVRKYHSGEEPRFTCSHEGCGKRFYERKLLVAHERIHSDERPFVCKYPGCDKRFRARNALAYHHKALHESGVVLRCTEAGCRFTTRKPEALATHKVRHQQRATAKMWKAQKKSEVQNAVKSAKDDLRSKSSELQAVQKQLAQEQKAHAKALKELNALKQVHAKMKRKVQSTTVELEVLRSVKRARTGNGATAGGGGTRTGGGAKGGASGSGAGVEDGGHAMPSPPVLIPEVILLDGPTGKMPMLAMDAPAALAAAAAAAAAQQQQQGQMVSGNGMGTVTLVGPPGAMPLSGSQMRPGVHPQGVVPGGAMPTLVNVNGTMRRLQPVCAQALPWSTSFIGCPGIRASEGLGDFTQLFKEDGSRDAGNRRTTPLEVEHPKDIAAFHARSTSCPWAKQNLQVTLQRASDPIALHALLNDIAPKKALKVKRVDGQCASCYAAHVALAARLRAKLHPKPAKGATSAVVAERPAPPTDAEGATSVVAVAVAVAEPEAPDDDGGRVTRSQV